MNAYQKILSLIISIAIPAIAEDMTIFQSLRLTPRISVTIKPDTSNMTTTIIWPNSNPMLKAKSWDTIFLSRPRRVLSRVENPKP